MVIDADVYEPYSNDSGAALAVAIPGDAMADTIARAQLLMSMRIISPGWSAHSGPWARRASRSRQRFEVMTRGDAANGGARQAGLLCNKIIDTPLPTQGRDLRLDDIRRPSGGRLIRFFP